MGRQLRPYVLRMGEEKHQPHAQSSLVSQQVFTECLDCAQCWVMHRGQCGRMPAWPMPVWEPGDLPITWFWKKTTSSSKGLSFLMCKIRRLLWLSSDVGFFQLELWMIPKQNNKFPEFLDLERLLGVGRLHNATCNNLSEKEQLGPPEDLGSFLSWGKQSLIWVPALMFQSYWFSAIPWMYQARIDSGLSYMLVLQPWASYRNGGWFCPSHYSDLRCHLLWEDNHSLLSLKVSWLLSLFQHSFPSLHAPNL